MSYSQLSGKVVYKGAKTGKHCTVTLSPAEPRNAKPIYAIVTPFPSRFHFAEVMPGRYRIDACLADEPALSGDGAAAARGTGGVIEVKERLHVENVAISLTDADPAKKG